MIVITNNALIYIMQRTNIPLRRFAEASLRELIMSSQFTAHFPADSIPRGDGGSGGSEQPVVLPALAKLTLMAAALIVLTPIWLQTLAGLAYDSTTFQAWGILRIAALVGGAGFITVAVMFLRVWTGLLKYLARRD